MQSKNGVCLVRHSGNEKTGRATALYQSMIACGSSCPFRGHGCYGQCGKVQMVEMRLTRQALARAMTAIMLAVESADQIRAEAARLRVRPMTEPEPMRVNVVGDCASEQAAAILSPAVEEWMDVTKQPAWGYTHSWPVVSRAAWGRVSILASVETAPEASKAFARGYAVATVDGEAISGELKSRGFRVLPCPAQTRGITCIQCRLCMRDTLLRKNRIVISFASHGSRARRIAERVAFIRGL